MEQQFKPDQLRPDKELVAEINKEYTLKGSMRKKPGLILFAVNVSKETCVRAHIKSEAVIGLNGVVKKQHKAFFDPEAIYTWAINEDRAIYKVLRDLNQFIANQEEKKRGRV